MNVIEGIVQLQETLPRPVVTVGTFDGVHVGHRAVLREVHQRALRRKGTSVVVTFEPHPQTVVAPETAPMLLTTREEKLSAFAEEDIHHTVLLAFTAGVARMEAREFVQEVLLSGIGAEELVIGCNHTFGRGRSGHLNTLTALSRELGFTIDAVPSVQVDGAPVSSTRIRRLINGGQIVQANRLLGRPYSLRGRVIRGQARGRMLGFPTANLEIDHPRKLVPGDGVYAVWVYIEKAHYQGVMNIGTRPSFGAGTRAAEIHVLHFEGNLYGCSIQVDMAARLRDELCFENEEALREQIERDLHQTEHMLSMERC